MMESVNSAVQAKQASQAMAIQMAVMRKGLDAMKSQGQAVLEILDATTQVGKAVGRGEGIDLTA